MRGSKRTILGVATAVAMMANKAIAITVAYSGRAPVISGHVGLERRTP